MHEEKDHEDKFKYKLEDTRKKKGANEITFPLFPFH